MQPKIITIIPARYASTRFPGKPLAQLGGKAMIQRVAEQAMKYCERVVVATDDLRILEHVQALGIEAVMTSAHHRSGTERCLEAYALLGAKEEILLNLQGDEPFIRGEQIESLIAAFDDEQVQIATLAEALAPQTSNAELFNPNAVKLVRSASGSALYFSRSPIPHLRGVAEDWCSQHTYYKHIGLYAFRTNILDVLRALPSTELEQAESLEQLRWLEHGMRIHVGLSQQATIGIDTPEDLARAEAYLQSLQ